MSEEMRESLLTNKKQENLYKVQADNIVTPTQTRINREKYTFCFLKLLKYFKKIFIALKFKCFYTWLKFSCIQDKIIGSVCAAQVENDKMKMKMAERLKLSYKSGTTTTVANRRKNSWHVVEENFICSWTKQLYSEILSKLPAHKVQLEKRNILI